MIIPVAGYDPSFRNWGIAEGQLCLDTGVLSSLVLNVIKTEKSKVKQVRTNSSDIQSARELADEALLVGHRNKVIFVECPVGSQSASGMKAYGASVGILGCMQSAGIQLIEVTAFEVKKALTGNKNATKDQMIQAAMALYPDANWPMRGGKVVSGTAEHMADSIGAIHAGVLTPAFQQLMALFQKVR